MTMSKLSLLGVTAAVVLLPSVLGCGAHPEDDAGSVAENEEVGSESEAIWGPEVHGRAAIEVRFETSAGSGIYSPGCSGVILNNQTFVTAAHCISGYNNGPRNVQIYYQRPSGNVTRTFGAGEVFFYMPDGWGSSLPAEWDVSVGVMAAPSSLNVDLVDFAMLYRGGMGGGTHFTQAGYGGSLAGPSGVQRRIVLQITWNGSQHVKWETDVAAGQMVCKGDSGGPGFRTSGFSDGWGPYWDAAAWVMRGGLSAGDCDDEGRASKLTSKVAWIRDIVEFWTPMTCTDTTTLNGQSAAFCWDPQ
jgi:hypothetical protein